MPIYFSYYKVFVFALLVCLIFSLLILPFRALFWENKNSHHNKLHLRHPESYFPLSSSGRLHLPLTERYRELAVTALDEVTENFREQFLQLSDSDLGRPTMRKQCLSETANFQVLFQDLAFVLEMLQGAIEHANKTDTSIVLVATLTRFGQKQDFLLPLGFLRREEVHALTVHYACLIAVKDPNLNVFWS